MKQDKKIQIRLSEGLLKALKAIDMGMSKFIRQAILEKLKRTKKAS